MNINSFYNWLNGAYDLGNNKVKLLNEFINDILFQQIKAKKGTK